MLVNRATERDWQFADQQGIDKSLFRVNDKGGRTAIIRLCGQQSVTQVESC